MEKKYLKKDDLKILIESLSLAEKRHFYQYIKSQNHQDSPYYLELFTALSGHESQLTQLPEMASKKAFSNAKIRLYQHLMQSLRIYHQNSSAELTIQHMICDIEILYDRGLPDQSLILLRKAQKAAAEQENFGLLLQLLTWERKINIISDSPTRNKLDIATEERKIFANFEEVNTLESIFSKVIDLKKRYGYVKGAALKSLDQLVLKNPKLLAAPEIQSRRGTYYFNFIHSLYHWLTLDHKQAYQYSKKLLAPELQLISPNEYLEGILQHVTSCMGLGYFEETLEGLMLADAFIAQKRFQHSTVLPLRVFYFRICYRLIVYMYKGALKELQDTIEDAHRQILQFNAQLSIEMKLVIYGNLRNACIATGDHEQAEKLLDMLLYKESKYVRKDVYNDLFLSRIFSHLASEDYALVPSMAAAACRQYKQIENKRNKYDTGLQMATLLMKNADYSNSVVRKKILTDIKAILHEAIIDHAGLNKFHEMYTFYYIWTDSILEDQPFHITAANWYAHYLKHL